MKTRTLKLVAATLLLLLPLGARAEDRISCVYLTLKGGEVVAFAISERPKIEYQGSKAMFSSEKVNVEYDVADVEKITFGSQLVDGIIGQELVYKEVSSHDGVVSFLGFEAGSSVMVYTLTGTLVDSRKMGEDGSLSIDTSSYPSGVYLFKNKKITYKLIKR